MAKVALGPVSLTGEYIMYSYAREYSYYGLNRDTSGAVVDSTLAEKSKDYAMSGLDLMPMISLLGRKLEVFGRFSTWEQKEEGAEGAMEVNLGKSLMRYGAGFNYHFLRRSGGSKPAVALQFAWVREQVRTEGADPKDTFMAQARFEWAHLFGAQ